MRTRSHRLSAAIGIAALNAWLAACGEVLPVDTDPRQDGGIADVRAATSEDAGSGADAANVATCDDCERLVFVTSGVFSGNLGGIPGADEKCRQAAAASTLPNVNGRSFKAWISATGSPASGRFAHGRKPYLLLDGTAIANDWSDLIDGNVSTPIELNESGNKERSALGVWTGTSSDGELSPGKHCMDWTSSSVDDDGYHGNLQQSNSQWTHDGIDRCSEARHLYCIED